MAIGPQEKRFLEALEALFTGAEVEGDSGFVNLMRIKRQYFKSIQPMLMATIDQRAEPETSFREELFDKLWTFFKRYFCESGSIYFRHLPAFAKTYERVYGDDQDVALSWKTQMLYYVKSDVLVRSMPVELPGRGNPEDIRRFYFDAAAIEHKRSNEKREFVFAFDKVDSSDGQLVLRLKVAYSEQGKKTKADDIIKQARNSRLYLSEDELESAFRVFRRQTEVDYFINKDARGFLREQFDLWLYQFMFKEESIFETERVGQLQAIKETAYDIIDFIAQFEDELRRAWEKPKFVRGVHYVLTLDKLPAKTLKKVAEHKGAKAQIKEWQQLGMVEKGFSLSPLSRESGDEARKSSVVDAASWQYLPLDTSYFKDMELEILDALGNLDEALDGELVHSENWQALNSLQKRYKGKMKCIHIDPPYNTKTSGFLYRNEYKHSSWLTMMENRISCSLNILSENGSYLCHIDENEYERLHLLMENSGLLDAGTVIWDKRNPVSGAKGVATQHEYVIWRMKTSERFFNRKQNAQIILSKANELIEKTGSVNTSARKKFKDWIRRQRHFSAGEKSYSEIDDAGRVYQSVHMGAPEQRKDKKFHIPLIHPVTEKPCPVPVSGWSGTPEFMQALLKEGKIIFGKDESVQPRRKYYLEESMDNPVSSVLQHGGKGKVDVDKLGVEFPYCHPVALYEYLIGAPSASDDIVLDYFAGSGTTGHAVINLNREDGGKRKYLLVEMGDYFHTVLLPRLKKVIYSKDWKDGQPASCNGSSHCLKYYALEQYEETLRNSRYEDGEQIEIDSLKSPFEQYVFCNDDKLAHAVQVTKKAKLEINLHDLYPDIDLAESLANALGKPIRRRSADQATFADGATEKINPAKMTEEEKQHFIALIKPYLWWGE